MELLESQGQQEPHQARAGPAEGWGEIIYLYTIQKAQNGLL